ncbi:Myb_DNA-bind_6 domain-containing protein, partial [Cephalotus follicularis]
RKKNNNVVKGQWTTEEDRLLVQLVEQFGVRKWSHIAQMLPGRIGKQCRERWHNHLRPDIKKVTWNEEEDKVLIEAHVEIGNKWAEIAKRLPGRTENSIKNHWNATKRRQLSKRKCRTKHPRGSLLQDYIKSLNLDSSTSRNQQKASCATDALANNITTVNAPDNQQAQAFDFKSSDRLVPNYDDFNEVPDLDFDEKLFQESCSIESLLDDMPCPAVVDDENGVEMEEQVLQMPTLLEFEVKKELDLVEMISQANL